MAPTITQLQAKIRTHLMWFATKQAMVGRGDREDALIACAQRIDERVAEVLDCLTGCEELFDGTPDEEAKLTVRANVTQCLEIGQEIQQAAAVITRRRAGEPDPPHGPRGPGVQVPLPAVAIPVFHGDYTDWTRFQDLFDSVIHNRTDLQPAYKMAQLMAKLQGEPHELVKHLPVDDASYETARGLLIERYSNKRLMIDQLLEQWLTVPTITRGTDLRAKVLNPVCVAVNALERQGMPVSGYDYILVHTLLRRLPSDMAARFEQSHGGKTSDYLPTFEELKSFLEAECRRVDAQFGESPHAESAAARRPERPGAQARDGKSRPPRRYNVANLESRCAYCREAGHQVTACEEFAAQRVQKRRGVVQQRRWCFRCMGPHQVRERPSSTNCRYCQGAHHQLLCMNRSGDYGGRADVGQRTESALPRREQRSPPPLRRSPLPPGFQGRGQGHQQVMPPSPRARQSPPRQQVPERGGWSQVQGQGHPSQVRDATGGCQHQGRYMQYSAGLNNMVRSHDPRMPLPLAEHPRLQAHPRYARLPQGYYRLPAMAYRTRGPYQQEWDPLEGVRKEGTPPQDADTPRVDSC
ncbi:hypothetical protein O0L34_g18203 [Tuta absoluta]|nr:hypothetical protein O0L34_g18203 [Tuta absoluta]